jgi:glycerol-3-phosphate acyltransferase PlsX
LARIALDVMGGDFAPQATVAGALYALEEIDKSHVIQLVGRTDVIERELDLLFAGELGRLKILRDRLELVEAPDVIEMTDKPSVALRGKPRSSMVVGLKLQVDGKSDAFVSAGNTGAQMAASVFLLKLHPGLNRPAISTIFPTGLKPVVVLDSGANVDCSAEELVQFARLGAVYAEDILGRTNPVIGLVSIGEEPEKGNAAVKEANQLLQQAGLNFQGNIEGRDIPRGESDRGPFDVAVCDGFTGNVVLKFYEAIAPLMATMLEREGIEHKQVEAAFRSIDYSEYGGAPLLGIRGVSIIAHGKSGARAIKNALTVGLRAHESKMSEHIGRRLSDAAAAGAPG